MKLSPKSLEAFDDGLFCPEVGRWSMDKYRILMQYNNMFATGMKNKWDRRIYIDLFSSAGIARIKDSPDDYVLTSSLIALNIPDPYDEYLFCDIDSQCLEALEQRVNKYFPGTKANYFLGDCNEKVDEIVFKLPKYSTSNTVLTFCVIDPYNIGIKFNTIEKLSKYKMDFLILLSWMDASRNEYIYVKSENERIDQFLGDKDWRLKHKNSKITSVSFRKFLAEEFVTRMMKLGYPDDAIKTMKEIRYEPKNMSLYHLAFFSKAEKGYEFWNKAKNNAPNQRSFLFEE
jgi:three-Cys-motif partner protein